ncbi:MAG: hypothetical protein AAF664_02380 [Planctomycetota bacterium]
MDDVQRVDDAFDAGSVPHDAPEHMVRHTHEATFNVQRPLRECWCWLNAPNTFTEGQVWPYRVEFISPDNTVPNGFHVGVLNWHYGPFLDFAGVITAVNPMEYRDLKYFYGSFAVSPRLIRPTRLQFWTTGMNENSTEVRLQVDSLIRRRWVGSWSWMQERFWKRFPKWMTKAIPAAS